MIYRFEVPGLPIAKSRPRFNRKTGRTWTPGKTTRYENLVSLAYKEVYPDVIPAGEPIRLTVIAYFPPPKATSKKRLALMLANLIHHVKRPDADNILKSVQDGLNKVAFMDDSQIWSLCVEKRYSEYPRVEVIIEETRDEI